MSIKKKMLFTSAGDNTDFLDWWVSSKDQNYDIFLMYYGTNEETYQKYKSAVFYAGKSKGSKFQNFYRFYKDHPEIIDRYDYFFIVDDDIEMKVSDINHLFSLASLYNLSICAPSFTAKSKISWLHTKHRPNRLLTYTNFIEVNTPLFTREALDKVMAVYDPVLIGWGIDFLCSWANGLRKKKAYAIIHSIQCTNPRDKDKTNTKRELSRIPGADDREQTWIQYAKKIGCPPDFPVLEYSSVSRIRRMTRKKS